jgi:hypothetical protein
LSRAHPLSPWPLVLLVLVGGASCGEPDPFEARREVLSAILQSHLAHEDAMLAVLERHRDEPRQAIALLERYLGEHGAAIEELCSKRRLLEADPHALAGAMRALEPRRKRVFMRRQALSHDAPELMAHQEVRSALAALEPL